MRNVYRFTDDPEGDIINESGNYTIGHRGISLTYKAQHPRQQGAWQLNHQVRRHFFKYT